MLTGRSLPACARSEAEERKAANRSRKRQDSDTVTVTDAVHPCVSHLAQQSPACPALTCMPSGSHRASARSVLSHDSDSASKPRSLAPSVRAAGDTSRLKLPVTPRPAAAAMFQAAAAALQHVWYKLRVQVSSSNPSRQSCIELALVCGSWAGHRLGGRPGRGPPGPIGTAGPSQPSIKRVG